MINQIIQKYSQYGMKTFFYFAYLELLKKLYWQPIRHSYSQDHEDLLIDKLLNYKLDGFYVDVGAYDPNRFSNTKRFYEKGWMGINIEPDYISYQKFVEHRERDINLNIGIAEEDSELTFYKMDTQTLSTFDKNEAEEYIKQGYKIVEEKKIPVKTLANVFEENLAGKSIDFMSVDTEGFDMQVLKSNDWKKYSPRLICIESVKHNYDHETAIDNEESKNKSNNQESFLISKRYKKVFDNGLNSIYLLKDANEQ